MGEAVDSVSLAAGVRATPNVAHEPWERDQDNVIEIVGW
jgi:hypothetical protein